MSPFGNTRRLRYYRTRDNSGILSVISARNGIHAALSLKLHLAAALCIRSVISEFFQANGRRFISTTRSYSRKSRVHRVCGYRLPSPHLSRKWQTVMCNVARYSAIFYDHANFETLFHDKNLDLINFLWFSCLT